LRNKKTLPLISGRRVFFIDIIGRLIEVARVFHPAAENGATVFLRFLVF
jgi:hypothetical protein